MERQQLCAKLIYEEISINAEYLLGTSHGLVCVSNLISSYLRTRTPDYTQAQAEHGIDPDNLRIFTDVSIQKLNCLPVIRNSSIYPRRCFVRSDT